MSEQTENELICEKLLGWKRISGDRVVTPDGACKWFPNDLPSFTTWAEVGLILEAMHKAGARLRLTDHGSCWECTFIRHRGIGLYDTWDRAIRAAALELIREQS